MIITALAIAFIVQSYILLCTVVPEWVFERFLQTYHVIIVHVMILVLSLAAGRWVLHIDIRNTLAVAFLADVFVQSRQMLDLLADLCKARILGPQRGSRR